ncbi:geranylgeranyl reductase family protein [Candidatus Bipolaricaulota bacterium]|nr:geranylgeranyl reductase family protein [Candidatus Bipolaricaulota bacterium]
MKFEVVVVGGGPAGALAARSAAEEGAKTLLLERAPKRRPCCAGLVSPATAERLGIPGHLILREIRAVRVFSPQGQMVELRAKEVKGLVLDRAGLDCWLREKAEEKGVEFWPLAATGLDREKVFTPKGTVSFEVVVGADGAYSTVARAFGLPRPREILVAIQAEIRAELGDCVEVHLGVVPDFFAWAVPEKEGVAKVGLATALGREAFPLLRDFLEPKSEILSIQTGLIPLGMPTKIAGDRCLLVGNAAGQVKPLTGGGLAFLSLCAPLAGRVAARGPQALSEYERDCRRMIGEEVSFQERARSIFLRLKPEALEEMVQTLSHPKLANFLAECADIDQFSSLPPKILARPQLWPLLLPLTHWLSEWGLP